MAISYLSPATYQNQLPTMPMGPLSGFLAGMNQDMANQIFNKGMEDDKLDQAVKQQALDEANALMPGKVAIQASDVAKANQDKRYYDDGGYADARASKDAAAKSDNSVKIVQNDVTAKQAAAPLWQQMAAELHELTQDGQPLSPMNPQHVAWYNHWYDQLHQYAPNMPKFPDPGDQMKIGQQGAAASQFISTMNSGANVKHSQEMEKAAVGPTIAAKASRENNADTNATNERIQSSHDQRFIDVQRLKQEHDELSKKYEESITKTIERAKKSGVIDDDARGAAAERAKKELNDDLKANGALRLQLLGKSPDEQRQILGQIVREKMEDILPGSTKHDRTAPNTSTTQQAGPTSGPKAGDVQGGYRFKGGNPADKNNWEKV